MIYNSNNGTTTTTSSTTTTTTTNNDNEIYVYTYIYIYIYTIIYMQYNPILYTYILLLRGDPSSCPSSRPSSRRRASPAVGVPRDSGAKS